MKITTEQQVLDAVVPLMRAQGRKSMRPPLYPARMPICAYRGTGGIKCAAGHLIEDEFYSEEMESETVLESTVLEALEKSGVSPSLKAFLREVQRDLHDTICDENFARKFEVELEIFCRKKQLIAPGKALAIITTYTHKTEGISNE